MLTNQDKTPILLRENRPGTLIQWPKDSSPVFEESQKLDRAWLWLLVFEFILLGIIFTISEVPWMAIIVIGFISSLAIILLRRMELKVKMDPKGIHLIMNMIFSKEEKTLPWSSIASIQVRKLTGFMERSGYGKKAYGNKIFYNLNGNKAISIMLHEGAQVIIGTRHSHQVMNLLSSSHT